jgi:hypothetical protein
MLNKSLASLHRLHYRFKVKNTNYMYTKIHFKIFVYDFQKRKLHNNAKPTENNCSGFSGSISEARRTTRFGSM